MNKRTKIDARKRANVMARAGYHCEYCGDRLFGQNQHIDHIHPISREGGNDINNLAYACTRCNINKGDSVEFIDLLSGQIVPLFNPRIDNWKEHFSRNNPKEAACGRTSIGRATQSLLWPGFFNTNRIKNDPFFEEMKSHEIDCLERVLTLFMQGQFELAHIHLISLKNQISECPYNDTALKYFQLFLASEVSLIINNLNIDIVKYKINAIGSQQQYRLCEVKMTILQQYATIYYIKRDSRYRLLQNKAVLIGQKYLISLYGTYDVERLLKLRSEWSAIKLAIRTESIRTKFSLEYISRIYMDIGVINSADYRYIADLLFHVQHSELDALNIAGILERLGDDSGFGINDNLTLGTTSMRRLYGLRVRRGFISIPDYIDAAIRLISVGLRCAIFNEARETFLQLVSVIWNQEHLETVKEQLTAAFESTIRNSGSDMLYRNELKQHRSLFLSNLDRQSTSLNSTDQGSRRLVEFYDRTG